MLRVCAYINVGPLIAAEGYFFCLDTKEAKNQVSKEASLPHEAFALQIGQNHGLQNLAATSFAQNLRLGKYCNALAAAPPTIVLPAFARSFFADRRK